MKHLNWNGIAVLFILYFTILPAYAIPIISIDMDPSETGIQSELTVNQSDIFSIDVVITGDGATVFDTALFDVVFNDAGSVLGLNSGPIAGSLAEMAPIQAFDAFDGPTAPGAVLRTGGTPPVSGFDDGIGGAGMLSIALPFDLIPAGKAVDIFSLTFQADAAGTSTLGLTGWNPPESPLLALNGVPILAELSPGSVNVNAAPVPEPATIVLLTTGILGMGVYGRKKRSNGK